MELVGECGSGKTQLCMQVSFTLSSPLWQNITPMMLSQRPSRACTPHCNHAHRTRQHLCGACDASMIMGEEGFLCRWLRSRR